MSASPHHRIGLVVPSSNTTMETELPELFRRREQVAPERLSAAASTDGRHREVVTSAGALADGVHALGARRVAMVTPYVPALTECVVDYRGALEVEVVDRISLGVTDNRAVGRLDPAALPGLVERLDLSRADAVVVSACVQMPSLAAVEVVEQRTGLPTLSAATATAYGLLRTLGLPAVVPGAGRLLDGTSTLALT